MFSTILFDIHAATALIRLNRPERLNAIGGSMRNEIGEALKQAAADESVRVVVLTGEGRGFSAGGDIQNLKELRDRRAEDEFRSILTTGQAINRYMRAMAKPVIAAVNGPCAGAGFSLALGCDIRIASDRASFGPVFARIGLHPDWGGSWLLPRLVGSAKACEMIFTGEMFSVAEAEKTGVVNRIVPHDDLMKTVMELAGKIAENPPGVIKLAKESIYRSLTSSIEEAFLRENDVQSECFNSDDFSEGLTAFLEKRKPQFRGR
jgi:enoyl-CoA hydratase/carnithine racemase